MKTYAYRLVNVFAETTFGGNPLCVFTDAHDLSTHQMQALALQFNLSETTFLLPSEKATARVRIFTPTFELDFAGHPTLGSAHVIRDVMQKGNRLTLEMNAGIIPVSAVNDRWTFTANAPTSHAAAQTNAQLAAALGLDRKDVLDGARWVSTGTAQLIIPLATIDAVKRVRPKADLLQRLAIEAGNTAMAYVFAPIDQSNLLARFFFMKHDSVIEDAATGSATANLGGWMAHHGKAPCHFDILQGDTISRPSHLTLEISAGGAITVSGRVIEIGLGEMCFRV